MRISKFMLPAVTVAGALALAGCGGGSSTPAGTTAPETPATPSTPATPAAPAANTLTLPGNGFLDWSNQSTPGPIRIAAGQVYQAGGGAWFQCPTGGATCVIQTGTGRATTVTYTGGALTVHPSDPRPVAGTTARSAEDTDPLSDKNLLASVLANGRIFGVSAGATGIVGTDGAPAINTFERADGHTTTLRMAAAVDGDGTAPTAASGTGADYVYYGYDWTKPTDAAGYTRTLRWGGSVEHGTAPVDGEATYAGTALTYVKQGTGNWQHGGNAPAVTLTADFGDGTISGTVGATEIGGTAIVNSAIGLGSTKIGSDGTFSGKGKAKFTANTGTALAAATGAGKGDWNGEFFGPTLVAGTAVDGVTPFTAADPTHAAGQFSVSRSGTSALIVHGAFGACNGTCTD